MAGNKRDKSVDEIVAEASATPPSPPSPPTAAQEKERRVYALPGELVERIVEFQREKGYPSEVEAVRRLLDDALKSRDTLARLISRFMTRMGSLRSTVEVAKDVLVGHPLVKSMSFDEDAVNFEMKDGWEAKINDKGDVWIWDPQRSNTWSWAPDEGRFGTGKITDDIPF